MTLTSRSPLLSPTITSSEASDYFHQSLIKLRTYLFTHAFISICLCLCSLSAFPTAG